MVERLFACRGRTLVATDRLKLSGPAHHPGSSGGGGLIVCWRPTVTQPRCLGFVNPAGSFHWLVGRSGSDRWILRNAGGVQAEHSTAVVPLNAISVGFAFTRTTTEHYLALDTAANFELNSTSVTNPGTLALEVGVSDNTAPVGGFVGQMFWLGVLNGIPNLDLLHRVLTQQAPPTILRPWLAHLLPFGCTTPERCILTGQDMVLDVGTPPVATIGIAQPQLVDDEGMEGLGTASRRFILGVSVGDTLVEVSTTAAPAGIANAVLLKLPVGTEREIGIAVDAQPMITATLAADANVQSGNLLLGAGMSAGVASDDADAASLLAVTVASHGDADTGASLVATARAHLAPQLRVALVTGPAATDNVLDLATIIADPSSAGYTIRLFEPEGDTLSLALDGTLLRFRAETANNYRVELRLDSLHPLQPSVLTTLQIQVVTGDDRYPNGYAYRRWITRPAIPGIGGGTRHGLSRAGAHRRADLGQDDRGRWQARGCAGH